MDLETYLEARMGEYFPEANIMVNFIPNEEAIEILVQNDPDHNVLWRGEAGSDDDWFCFKASDNGQILTIPFPPEYNEE